MINTKNMEDKKAEIKKKAAKAIIAASTASSVVVGGLYSSPEDLLHPKPVIMNITEDEDFYDEHVRKEPTWRDRLKNYINNLPLLARVIIVLPLWAIGFLIIALTTNLWKMIVSPILAHLSVWVIIAFVMLASLVAFGKIMYPKIDIRKFINKNTLLVTGITVGMVIVAHLLCVNLWSDYEDYIRQVQIAMVAIGLVCGSYQLYHQFYQNKLVVTSGTMVRENTEKLNGKY
ncbi:MAG: hypothetical protein E7187_07320 [Erysipelotrichaceae bacterium]|nr:hypothetical protein [Erysipelotrichaceae bacterium]